jgi:hypothetical protein
MNELRQRSEAWNPQESTSKVYETVKALTEMAIRRQADVSKETYAVFADDLKRFNIEDIRAACRAIGTMSRKQGDKAFPEVGMIIAECERQEKMRRRDAYKGIRCPDCCDGLVYAPDGRGVLPCRSCNAATWFQDSLAHNASQRR